MDCDFWREIAIAELLIDGSGSPVPAMYIDFAFAGTMNDDGDTVAAVVTSIYDSRIVLIQTPRREISCTLRRLPARSP